MTKQLVLATGNLGKVKELADMLAPYDLEVLPQSHFKVSEVEETGTTFVENAIIKARHAAYVTGLPAIADDSGLEVDFLKGAPGIYSARFAGPHANDQANIDKLLHELDGVPESQRTARFHCVLVLMAHADDPTPVICHGTWEGFITTKPHGENGFGYDPVFFVPSEGKVSAELSKERKNQLSHRGKALQLLSTKINKKLGQ
ncbi:XTP/dITP diphosphatase [Motilimonas eburnea]|uniref:XTP/dITP diphosphatase n=1 Tax=Motilimonas eburnea TaxID=1737488 RepID=UPI001E2D4DEA|nr:XTP/dITP diphosphatase [Motilimonas eburnea]MCE2571378.1 XTP/dITP diphosphatase [Motilimonas eburnea]